MNYFIDLLPNKRFIEKIININDSNIIFNMYISQIPTMNMNKNLYCDIENAKDLILYIKEKGYRVNIMFDVFCFGNKEFTNKGKDIFYLLDKILELNIDYITITNNFFFNYINRRHKECKIIMSEYCEITNVQKITRFLEDLKADGVKIDNVLAKNSELMEYIKSHFDADYIHIDANKITYENDIYKDYLNNSMSHFLQDGKWEEANKLMEKYKKEQKELNNKEIFLEDNEIKQLVQLGYKNFWYYCNTEEEKYINQLYEKLK